MKKIIIIISLLSSILLCGYIWNNSKQANENNQTLKERRIPDFEKPKEKPNISGIVKAVVGNEITILKIERQTKPEINEKNENTEIKTETRGGMGMGSRLNTTTVKSDEQIEMLKSMSIGEEKIIIPVGIKILKNENEKIIEATLNDITKDKILTIWTNSNDSDKNIANFIIIN